MREAHCTDATCIHRRRDAKAEWKFSNYTIWILFRKPNEHFLSAHTLFATDVSRTCCPIPTHIIWLSIQLWIFYPNNVRSSYLYLWNKIDRIRAHGIDEYLLARKNTQQVSVLPCSGLPILICPSKPHPNVYSPTMATAAHLAFFCIYLIFCVTPESALEEKTKNNNTVQPQPQQQISIIARAALKKFNSFFVEWFC